MNSHTPYLHITFQSNHNVRVVFFMDDYRWHSLFLDAYYNRFGSRTIHRLDPTNLQEFEQLLLRLNPKHFLARANPCDGMFIQRESTCQGVTADRYIKRIGPREIEDRKWKLFRRCN